MLQNPLISVIVPVYKVEKYLSCCLDSIIGQTYSNLEIILVDDGSPDTCGQICEEYARKDSRIRVIHQENQGLSGARNAGLRVARGSYIGFVDSDDYIDPDMYEYLYQLICKDQADIAMCNICEDKGFRSAQSTNVPYTLMKFVDLFQLADWMYVWNKLYKKEILSSVQFNTTTSFGEDELFNFEIAKQEPTVAVGGEAKYHYCCRFIADRLTRTFQSTHLNKIILAEECLKYAQAHHWTVYCRYHPARVQFRQASNFLIQLARTADPRREDVSFLTNYLKQHLGPFLQAKTITKRRKMFVLAACVNFNLARNMLRFVDHLKGSDAAK
ncbi:MAG: glycosyltransferase [Elusimicrobiaceae bacterium]|nr:glycosyltransferase [Elusimicrobiaceae bacterium]